MRYKLARKYFEIWKNEIYILPTIRIGWNERVYVCRNFHIEIHFLCFHIRLLWLENETE